MVATARAPQGGDEGAVALPRALAPDNTTLKTALIAAVCLGIALGTHFNPDNNYVSAASILALVCCIVAIRSEALRRPH